jgi:diaminopimelate epimerase
VTSILRGRTDRELDVELRGGTLRLAWPADDAAVIMTGPAVEVFRGRIPLGEGV